MYESQHDPDHTIPKNSLTEIDYQLMMEAGAYVKYNPKHTEYQAHSLQLNPSMNKTYFHQEEYDYGSDLNNSSTGSVPYKYLGYQNSCFNQLFSNSDYAGYSVPAPSNMIIDSSNTDKNNFNQVPPSAQHLLNGQYTQYSANPYLIPQENFGNASDPSLEGYATIPSFHDGTYNQDFNKDPNATWYDQHLEQNYGRPLDGQQLVHQKTWFQQVPGYMDTRYSYSSPSSFSSSYTTENNDSKSQIYVRKACVSCKQSHVACDVQRPCSRCVRLNKTETCVDAQRKKRGRPCGSGKKKKEGENEFRRQYQQYF